MTRKLLAFFLPLLLLVFVSTVNADNATTGSARTAADSASKLKKQMQQVKREELKTRIQTIKNQKKKALIERIDAKLIKINKKQTEKFSEALVRLQGFLDKIKQSAINTKVLADVTIAQTAVDTAKAAVEIQTAKTYIMEITDDAALKLNAGTVVSQLRQDLTAVHKLVIDAKQAVQKLNTEKSTLKKEATKSAEL